MAKKPSEILNGSAFNDVIMSVLDGKKIYRRSWPSGEECFIKDGMLMIRRNGEHRWLISDGDLLGDDWEVLVG